MCFLGSSPKYAATTNNRTATATRNLFSLGERPLSHSTARKTASRSGSSMQHSTPGHRDYIFLWGCAFESLRHQSNELVGVSQRIYCPFVFPLTKAGRRLSSAFPASLLSFQDNRRSHNLNWPSHSPNVSATHPLVPRKSHFEQLRVGASRGQVKLPQTPFRTTCLLSVVPKTQSPEGQFRDGPPML